MNAVDVVFGKDIVLDEAAFQTAIEEFAALSDQLQQLRNEVEDMLNALKAGFDTPAGRKFINSCEQNLYKPLDDQKLVLDHISTTLLESKQKYDSVFREYEALQAVINQVNT